MKITIARAMASLSKHRPIFHSEADFQHALAWELRHIDSSLDIRLEVPLPLNSERRYVDLIVRSGERVVYLELKYKTREARHHYKGELFELKNQGATDQGAYDILKDLCRIENFVGKTPNSEGFVIVVSNDSRYWAQPPSRSKPSIDEQFKLTDNRLFQGTLRWHPSAGQGSIKGREQPIQLRQSYTAHWSDYTQEPESFRSLCFHVDGLDHAGADAEMLKEPSQDTIIAKRDVRRLLAPDLEPPEAPQKQVGTPPDARPSNWQLVLETLMKLDGPASLEHIRDRFAVDHPGRNPCNVRHELVLMAVNHPKRIHYGQARKPRLTTSNHPVDRLFRLPDGRFEIYSPDKHGIWEIYQDSSGKSAVRQAEV
ncbi:hypothetical protein [Prosthecobacter sp.]|uniref:DUF7669 domain-containing protein n=1 Tax=Prosthecobacter sp. TaxID=1965333 RepID=UPI0037830328